MDKGDVVKIMIPDVKPKSYSMSAEREGEFDITFKKYPGGLCSGYLDSLAPGDSIQCFKMGRKQRNPGGFVGVIAFGVGITEALPLVAAELSKPEAEQVELLWASKTHADTFWHDQIRTLQAEHPKRFRFTSILSRERRDGALHGRITSEVLAAVFDGHWGTGVGGERQASRDTVRFLSVGTKPMMRETDQMLAEIGYPMEHHALLA